MQIVSATDAPLRRYLPVYLAMAVVLALFAAACGSDESTAEPGTEPTEGAEQSPEEQPTEAETAEPAPDDAAAPTPTEAAASFEGETIRIVVGFSAGGGFDTVARLIAQHLAEHLPGNPNVIVQNMPGGSSLVAANTVYQMQPGDGRTIVMMHFGPVLDQILGTGDEAEFDAFEWIWLGEPAGEPDPGIIYVHDDLGIETMEDLGNHPETLFVGTQNRTAPTTMIVEHLSRAGWPLEVIYGYPGTSELDLAFEQRELDVASAGAAYTLADEELLSNVNVLASLGTNEWFQENDVPDLRDMDLGLSDEGHQFIDFLYSARSHVRLFAVPPGTDPDRVEALRNALETTLTDPAVMEEVEAIGLIPGYTSGQQVQQTVSDLIGTPADVVELYHEYAEESE